MAGSVRYDYDKYGGTIAARYIGVNNLVKGLHDLGLFWRADVILAIASLEKVKPRIVDLEFCMPTVF